MGLFLTGCGGSQLASGPLTPTPPSVPAEPTLLPAPAMPATPADAVAGLVDYSAMFAQYEPSNEPNGDLTKVVWPQWLLDLDPEIKQLYEFQIVNGPLMRYMPCFCGCQVEDGHRSNRNCYVDTVHPDGSVVLDTMAPT